VIGVAVNHSAVDIDRELNRLHWKVDAGADFAVTQPVFDAHKLDAFARRAGNDLSIPVIASVWPLLSARNAEFLANEVPGVDVPPRVLKRMRAAQEKGDDAARAEGVLIARDVIQALGDMVQGIQLSAPLGLVEAALEVIGH
jgi:homocysteine S-methyltransferase